MIYPNFSNKSGYMGEIYENIPWYSDGVWSLKSFESREEYAIFLETHCLREPGEYELDETSFEFNKNATFFQKHNYFCAHLEGTIDFKKWWNWEKYKSRKGVFYTNNGKIWYLPRGYYFWINFLKIVDKIKRKDDFPEVHDAQLHMSLYEYIGEVRYENGVTLKKRQFGSSLYHIGDLINLLWFEPSVVLKIGASLEAFITGINGNWKFAELYRDFLNEHTPWVRHFGPDEKGSWQQQLEVTTNGITIKKGLKGTLESRTFEKSPTSGVGGLTTKFFYEEFGIAPTADQTLLFMAPAMEAGDITTGQFLGAGTVGELKHCEPLRKMMYSPKGFNIYTIPNKWADDKGNVVMTPLFIPEQYAMKPYIDEFGNSLVDQALEALKKKRAIWKEELDDASYQLKVSQHPMNMAEAFANREESIFPQALVNAQELRIEQKTYPYELIDLEEGPNGIVAKTTNKLPIMDFPVNRKLVDKSGSIVVWKRPIANAPWETYYATVDPVSQGKTTTSVSLCSIQIYKAPVEVIRVVNGEMRNIIEGDELVAAWCGRFDDLNMTHRRLELLIEWYNAWTLVENNVSQFITYMIHKRKSKYLIPSNQMMFLKEHQNTSSTVNYDFGWRNTGRIFYDNILPYFIASLSESIDEKFDEDGNVISKRFGIERYPDIMLMKEMKAYVEGLNVDRLVSMAALIAFIKIKIANRGYKKIYELENEEDLDISDKITKLNRTPFKHIGVTGSKNSSTPVKRNPFKHLK